MNPTEWSALVVDEISEHDLNRVAESGYTTWTDLKTRTVQVTSENSSKVAVLSWRWNTDETGRLSRNIWAALRLARQLGFHHLFVDVVSIDQRLAGSNLLREVLAFTDLYKTIPVIAAYDKIESDFLRTMRRPWIANEVMACRYNPTRIIYAGHDDQGVVHGPRSFHPLWVDVLPVELKEFAFARMVSRIWRTGLCPSIIGVLEGSIGMHTISDLRFLMPEHSEILTIAFETMSQNDYLLTAAILSQIGWDKTPLEDSPEPFYFFPWDFFNKRVKFDRYTIISTHISDKYTLLNFALDDVIIAKWDHKHNDYLEYENIFLHVEENAEKVIFKALMQQDFDFETWHRTQRMPLQKRNEELDTIGMVPAFELFSDKSPAAADGSFVLVKSTQTYAKSGKPSGIFEYDQNGNPSSYPIRKVWHNDDKLRWLGVIQ